MTKFNEPNETQLSDLYQRRKNRHRAPSSVKRHVMSQAQDNAWWPGFSRNISSVAIAACTVLTLGLMVFMQYQAPLEGSNLTYEVVEIHSLEERAPRESERVRHMYAQHYNEFLERQQLYAIHHSKSAILSQQEDGWELETCDQELVKVSNDLIHALQGIDRIEGEFKDGDLVNIDFDQTGIILGILSGPQYPHC